MGIGTEGRVRLGGGFDFDVGDSVGFGEFGVDVAPSGWLFDLPHRVASTAIAFVIQPSSCNCVHAVRMCCGLNTRRFLGFHA